MKTIHNDGRADGHRDLYRRGEREKYIYSANKTKNRLTESTQSPWLYTSPSGDSHAPPCLSHIAGCARIAINVKQKSSNEANLLVVRLHV